MTVDPKELETILGCLKLATRIARERGGLFSLAISEQRVDELMEAAHAEVIAHFEKLEEKP